MYTWHALGCRGNLCSAAILRGRVTGNEITVRMKFHGRRPRNTLEVLQQARG